VIAGLPVNRKDCTDVPELVSIAEWNPALNDEITLRAAYGSMPGGRPADVPWYVRLLENPASPAALPGAVDLFGHDCIHIVLGRGMLPQDEAFVVGFTMGASGKLAGWQRELFTLCARHVYRGPYRFSGTDRLVFNLAASFAARSARRPVHDAGWHDLLDLPAGEVRASLGISTRSLIGVYDSERALCPGSTAAMRLARHGDYRAAGGFKALCVSGQA
jgi:hypothetical protein